MIKAYNLELRLMSWQQNPSKENSEIAPVKAICMKIIRVSSVTKKFGDEIFFFFYSDTKPIGKVKSSLGSGPSHEEFNRRREAIKSYVNFTFQNYF